MRRLLVSFGILILACAAHISAQETPEPDSQTARREGSVPVSTDVPPQGIFPRFNGRALVLDINARLVEQNETVIWNEVHQKTTLPGRPVGIKLVGTNIVVVAQFTPYVRRGAQTFLVAQGQVWMEVPGQGIRYHWNSTRQYAIFP